MEKKFIIPVILIVLALISCGPNLHDLSELPEIQATGEKQTFFVNLAWDACGDTSQITQYRISYWKHSYLDEFNSDIVPLDIWDTIPWQIINTGNNQTNYQVPIEIDSLTQWGGFEVIFKLEAMNKAGEVFTNYRMTKITFPFVSDIYQDSDLWSKSTLLDLMRFKNAYRDTYGWQLRLLELPVNASDYGKFIIRTQ